jgi:hypothetical protein
VVATFVIAAFVVAAFAVAAFVVAAFAVAAAFALGPLKRAALSARMRFTERTSIP